MKCLLLPLLALLIVLPVSADETPESSSQPTPSNLSNDEKTRILAAASRLLDNAISFHGDGTATTIYRANGQRFLLEMRGLVVRQLIHGSVAIEEREAGVSRRIFAKLHTNAFRTSSSGGQTWTPWQTYACPVFPSHMLIEEVHGRLTISVPALANFSPSPDPKVIAPGRELMPHERVVARR